MMDCGPMWMPFVYKVIRASSVLSAPKHLQMMRNTALKHPQPTSHALLLGEHVCVGLCVCVRSHQGPEIALH